MALWGGGLGQQGSRRELSNPSPEHREPGTLRASSRRELEAQGGEVRGLGLPGFQLA